MTDNDTSTDDTEGIEFLLCRGCGLITTEYVHEDNQICWECFNRHNARVAGGPLRVVTSAGTYHETPLCPGVQQASEWYYWRDEQCMHADLAGNLDKCIRCHSFHSFGFDEYVGDEERQVVIGHV